MNRTRRAITWRDRLAVATNGVAPQVAARARQAFTMPLSRPDPERTAAAVDARLDRLRARLDAMATSGRQRRGERELLSRELRAAAEHLAQVAPRLTRVRALTVRARLEAYTRAVQELPAPRRSLAGRRGREALMMAGAAAGGWAALELPAGVALGTGACVLALGGAATLRARRRRGEHHAALADAVVVADDGLPRLAGHTAADLDRLQREVMGRTRAARGLDDDARRLLDLIDAHLRELLTRALTEEPGPDVAHLVRATITDYLPNTLDPFLALPDPGTRLGERTAVQELADQLRRLEGALARARSRPSRDEPATRLLVQGEFLRSKFGSS
jgi:hypothetical protein